MLRLSDDLMSFGGCGVQRDALAALADFNSVILLPDPNLLACILPGD